MSTGPLLLRTRAAVAATRAVNALSRRLGAGGGTVAGGHAGLFVDPRLLERLTAGRRVALVSGTNGKTTTTRLLAAAIEGTLGRAATNATGSNMPTGHVTALAGATPGSPAVLEVDEGYLPQLVGSLAPCVVVLLNLSRDQLDRTGEVRMVADKWRRALSVGSVGGAGTAMVTVANADDPLVAWAASGAAGTVWVGAGLSWRQDAVGCPSCEGRITFVTGAASAGGAAGAASAGGAAAESGWACACGFTRPRAVARLDGEDLVLADGRRLRVALALPGRFNRANAVMAATAAVAMGAGWDDALRRIGEVREVAGRFAVVSVGGCAARVMLAKNPAGWHEMLDVVCPGERPVVVGINARVADGRDPSWLWDVPFERLRGRAVVATGERCRDLSVRLHYAEVPHRTVRDEVAAVRAAWMAGGAGVAMATVGGGEAEVDFVGNYTAFTDLMARAARRIT